MALKPCRECKKEISTDAKVCPNCGKPSPTQSFQMSTGAGCLIVFLVVVIVAAISGSGSSSTSDTGRAQSERESRTRIGAKMAVERLLKDPESAKFEDVAVITRGDTVTACGYVNARNGFGGYTGREPFLGGEGYAILPSVVGRETFNKMWNRLCRGM